MAKTFRCSLVTPEQQVLDEAVTYAQIPLWDGQAGIAPDRAPLLAKLGDGPLRLDFSAGGSRWFFLGGGFVQVKDNRLSLVTGEAVAAEQIVRADAQTSLREAEARVARTDAEVTAKQRQLTRARTLVHLFDQLGNKV